MFVQAMRREVAPEAGLGWFHPPIATANASTTAPNQSICARAAAMTPEMENAMVPTTASTMKGVLSVAVQVAVQVTA